MLRWLTLIHFVTIIATGKLKVERDFFMILSNEFNEYDYLEANPDVALAVANGEFTHGLDHFKKYGEIEGRPLCTHAKLRAKKVFHLLDKSGLGLEIGPSHRPLAPKRAGYNVHTLDHASAAELRAKYQDANVDISNIEDVDFVWHGEPYPELIGQKHCYDWIISSHVIEHVPDLISHIKECEILLKANGFLSLIIPDKRYCFDYFQPLTSTGDLLDAFAERRK
jgi:SAM-dependent methyltransferase